ncbi:hypothetical protein CLIB1423_17S00628 [[Candida] railenensis]|uniref:SH3 domain-containing protein n=1 Tax=[Candida] railenensis TaxID=45579 RepID=A0A9P0QT56_9ASCO|nr:hypothetical protein CLIB1423_17S00628 [[Candida] railenensis]
MNIVNKGVSGISSISHTVKDGTIGISHEIGNKFQDGLDKTNSVKDKMLFKKKAYDVDDDLIEIYESDISTSIAGLKYLLSQLNHMKKSYWPLLFKKNIKIAERFISIIGASSLQFKDINQYYQKFSQWQSEQEVPMVHPKERQFLIGSVCSELDNYLNTMKELQDRVLGDWTYFVDDVVKLKITQMNKFLKDILKVLKLRKRKKNAHDKLYKKVSKLSSKTSPLTDKEHIELNDKEHKLKELNINYNKVNDKVKKILPHALSFLEEFIDSITKLIICKQHDIYKTIQASFKYYSIFHGLSTEKDYELINESWKMAIEPIRKQIETSVKIIYDKKPELVDTEISTEVVADSKIGKMVHKVGHTFDKKNPVKPRDSKDGIFNEHQVADPLVSFERYKDLELNVPRQYKPVMIGIDDVVVPGSQLNSGVPSVIPSVITSPVKTSPTSPVSPEENKETLVESEVISSPVSIGAVAYDPTSPPATPLTVSPPPLPPRGSNLAPPVSRLVTTPTLAPPLPPRSNMALPTSTPRSGSTPVFSPIFSPPPPYFNGSTTDNLSDSDDDSEDASEMTSISSATSTHSVSSLSSTMYDKFSNETLDRNLTKIYNSAKNNITKSPVDISTQEYNISLADHLNPILFEDTTSLSYKIWKFNEFFNEVEKKNGKKEKIYVTAKHDFKGENVGDLSFKKNDKIQILFDFVDSHEESSWLVGVRNSEGLKRVGLVPSTYVERDARKD